MVSIIVPIYNASPYLKYCIEGVLAQEFKNWELILIDDGSTDNSLEVCNYYAGVDERIRIIHKSNTGVSDTRNIGLDYAVGNYVMFLDADDFWYKKNVLEKLYLVACNYDLDIIRGDYKAVNQEGDDLFVRPQFKSQKDFANHLITSANFYSQILCGENFLFLAMFKRSAIGSLRFNTERIFLEDMEFYARLLLQPLRCMYIPFRFYAYRKIPTSASNIPRIKNLSDSFAMCDVFNECSLKAFDKGLSKAYKYNSIMMYYWTLETMASAPYYRNRSFLIDSLLLNERQRQVQGWAQKNICRYPLIVFVRPFYGILFYRCLAIAKAIWVRAKRLLTVFASRVDRLGTC